MYFLDYLRASLNQFDHEGQEFDFLLAHKALIVKQSNAQKKAPRIAAKFRWVATYHNSVIRGIGEDQFSARGLDINDFLIRNDDSSLVVEF